MFQALKDIAESDVDGIGGANFANRSDLPVSQLLRSAGTAEEILHACHVGTGLNLDDLIVAVQQCRGVRSSDAAYRLVDLAERRGIRQNTQFCIAMASVCTATGKPSSAMKWATLAHHRCDPDLMMDKACFREAADAALSARLSEMALFLLQDARSYEKNHSSKVDERVWADAHMYTAAIGALVREGRIGDAQKLFLEMKNEALKLPAALRHALQPTAATYTALIIGWGRVSRSTAQRVVEEMLENGLKCDEQCQRVCRQYGLQVPSGDGVVSDILQKKEIPSRLRL